ncbi:MAG: TRAP transporter small permease subunit [Planctomycetota bacterium]|nr:TRAP transporter small permease subunit [Planctomycetota bacterium]
MLKRLEALSRWISYGEQAILVLCLTTMILFAFAQVLLRFLPNEWSVTWLEPFARQLVLWVGLIGASFATAEGRHISIEALPKLLNAKQKKWLGVFLQLAAAGLALALGLLAWTWLVDIDRKEFSDAELIAHTLEEKAKQYKGQERSKIIESIKTDVEKRVNTMRLEGFARLIRFRRITALTLSSLDDGEAPFVAPAKALLEGDKSLDLEGEDPKNMKALAAVETIDQIAAKFEEAAAAYAKGDDTLTKKAFEDSPVDADIVTASKDPVSEALYEMIRAMEKKPEDDPSALLLAKAKLTLSMADQKAFMELGGIHVHEWWFHVIVPIALFIMAFRFLINSFAALILSPEEYEARAETLQKDIEAFEAGKEQDPDAPPPTEAPPLVPTTEPIPEALPAAAFDPDSEAPPGALETVDLPPREGLFEDVDKAPPPRTRSGLVPKQADESDEDDELTASELDASDSTEQSAPETSTTQALEKPKPDDAQDSDQGDGKKGGEA